MSKSPKQLIFDQSKIDHGKLYGLADDDHTQYFRLDQTTPQTVVSGVPIFNVGLKTPLIYPLADSTSAIKINKADGTTNILSIDSTNSRIGIGTTTPDTKLQVVGNIKVGDDNTNYTNIGATGDQTFVGSAGFYPRTLNQASEPAAGTGATELDAGEMCIWTDSDDAKCYFCYNHGGTVKTIEMT